MRDFSKGESTRSNITCLATHLNDMIRIYDNSPEMFALATTIMKCANKTPHEEYLFFISNSYLYLMHVKYFPKTQESK